MGRSRSTLLIASRRAYPHLECLWVWSAGLEFFSSLCVLQTYLYGISCWTPSDVQPHRLSLGCDIWAANVCKTVIYEAFLFCSWWFCLPVYWKQLGVKYQTSSTVGGSWVTQKGKWWRPELTFHSHIHCRQLKYKKGHDFNNVFFLWCMRMCSQCKCHATACGCLCCGGPADHHAWPKNTGRDEWPLVINSFFGCSCLICIESHVNEGLGIFGYCSFKYIHPAWRKFTTTPWMWRADKHDKNTVTHDSVYSPYYTHMHQNGW